MIAVDMTGSSAEDYADLDALDELERVTPTSPPGVELPRPPSGGEHHDELVWSTEFADRWAALQPLLMSTIDDEEAADG